jgi:hypothetical protein
MSEDTAGTKFISNLVGLYMMTVMVMGVYYNWQYAREHGFVQWVFLGEIVPSAKALVWPYFAFGDQRSQVSQQTAGAISPNPPNAGQPKPRQLTEAEQQDHDREANSVTRKLTESIRFNLQYDRVPRGQVPQPVLDKMKAYQEEMFKEGSEIDIEVLNSAYPELGNHFRDQFLRSLSLAQEFENEGIEMRKNGGQAVLTPEAAEKFGAAKELSQQWADYYGTHYQEMLAALKTKWGEDK